MQEHAQVTEEVDKLNNILKDAQKQIDNLNKMKMKKQLFSENRASFSLPQVN